MAPRKSTKPTKTRATRSKPEPKPTKPVFRMGTWITLLVFIAVIAGAIYLNQKPVENAEEAEATPELEAMFVFDIESVVTSLEVKPAEGDTVKLERNEENVWVLTQPEEGEADQGAAEAAASQLGALLIDNEIDGDPSIFGFDEPAYVITAEFEDGTTGTLEIGDLTPTNNGYYVRLNNDKMYIVSMTGIDSLTNLVNFPPYLSPPTPIPAATETPLPTETAVPATEAESTPEATPTP